MLSPAYLWHLLTQKLDLFSATKPVGPSPGIVSINPKLLHGHHILDIDTQASALHLDEPSQALIQSPFGSRILHLLSLESQDIDQSMQKAQSAKD